MGAHPTLLITGASGLAGAAIHRLAAFPVGEGASARGTTLFAKWRLALAIHRRSAPAPLRAGDRVFKADLAERGAAANLVAACEPQAVIHLAAMASLAECEADRARATRINVDATAELARAAADAGAWFVFLSTDQVFDGEPPTEPDGSERRYREDDAARPLTVYGESKLAAERAVLAAGEHLVVRAALLLAPSADGKSGALDLVRGAAPTDRPPRLFSDEWRTPLSVIDLARLLDEALKRRASGVLHAAGPDRVSRLELGARIAAAFPPPAGAAPPIAATRGDAGHRRPRDVSLAIERIEREGWPRPAPLDAALAAVRELAALTTTTRRG